MRCRASPTRVRPSRRTGSLRGKKSGRCSPASTTANATSSSPTTASTNPSPRPTSRSGDGWASPRNASGRSSKPRWQSFARAAWQRCNSPLRRSSRSREAPPLAAGCSSFQRKQPAASGGASRRAGSPLPDLHRLLRFDRFVDRLDHLQVLQPFLAWRERLLVLHDALRHVVELGGEVVDLRDVDRLGLALGYLAEREVRVAEERLGFDESVAADDAEAIGAVRIARRAVREHAAGVFQLPSD